MSIKQKILAPPQPYRESRCAEYPKFTYEVIRNDDSKNKSDRQTTHRVKDFDAWPKVYDEEGIIKRMEED
jgi:hypothetical protein